MKTDNTIELFYYLLARYAGDLFRYCFTMVFYGVKSKCLIAS